MTDTEEQLKRMVMTFRVSELQMLLGYAGKNKTGRKNELQSRALDVVRMRNPSIHQKIRELYKSIQLEMMSFGDRSQVTSVGANLLPNQRVPSGLSPTLNYSQSSNLNTTGYSSRNSSQVTNMRNNVGYTSMPSSHNNAYPLSPDVQFKKLPFYDVLGELLKPSTLAPQGSGRYQEAAFTFCLTPQQANKIAHSRDLRPGRQDYTVQVQMRFCLLETTSEQEDNFPPNITVKINDKMCPLPSPIPTNKAGVEPKRPSRPVNLTPLCKISPTVTNRVHVSWSSEYGRCYVVSVYLVQKLTSEDLLQRLKTKGPRLADFTKSLIKLKLREDSECEIATTSLRCSLLCPLGKMRMVLPCRAETCIHLQCFDASLYLLMNERKPTWTCPVCDKPALYDHLVIDGYFQEVLMANSDCTEVTLQKDGGWTPLIVKKDSKEEQAIEKRKSEVAIETLSDDSNDEITNNNDDSVIEEISKKRKKDSDVEIITLDSEDEDERPPPPPSSKRMVTSDSSSPSGQSQVTPPLINSGSSLSQGRAISNGSLSSGPTETSSSSSSFGFSSGKEEAKSAGDSWCVGEVDPGKKLVFRKAMTNSVSNGGSQLPCVNNDVNQSIAGSNGSSSPQIICLDSPVASPQPAQSHQEAMNNCTSQNSIDLPIISSPLNSVLSSPPPSLPNSSSTFASIPNDTTLNHHADTLLSPHLPQMSPANESLPPSSSAALSAYNLLQDPLSTSNYGMLPPLSSTTTPPYPVAPGSLPNLFNPMMAPNVSPPPNPSGISFRPQDPFI